MVLNRSQKNIVFMGVVALILLSLFPHWRYRDGRSAGYAPVWARPVSLADTSSVGPEEKEYQEIKIVPQNLYKGNEKQNLSPEEVRRPFVDVRRVLNEAGGLFLVVAALVIGIELKRRR